MDALNTCFNPLDRVKFVQIPADMNLKVDDYAVFQSPRSGQICSNREYQPEKGQRIWCFNPLDRVKFVQINDIELSEFSAFCFNPLDRVKFVQIKSYGETMFGLHGTFQSPRSGQICSNYISTDPIVVGYRFQSPRSGQICSNYLK